MATQIDIDKIDVKILYALIKNARTKAKTIAEECNITTTAVINRIDQLKKSGIIKGSVLMLDFEKTMGLHLGSIEIENIKCCQAEKILEVLSERSNILLHNFCTGKSALTIFFATKSEIEISNLKSIIRKYADNGRINVSFWKTPHHLHENLKIEPKRGTKRC